MPDHQNLIEKPTASEDEKNVTENTNKPINISELDKVTNENTNLRTKMKQLLIDMQVKKYKLIIHSIESI